MPCNTINTPGGGYAIICRGRTPAKKCFVCGKPAGILCDYPKVHGNSHNKNGTCDRALCDACTTKAGDSDLCPEHAEHWRNNRLTPEELKRAGLPDPRPNGTS